MYVICVLIRFVNVLFVEFFTRKYCSNFDYTCHYNWNKDIVVCKPHIDFFPYILDSLNVDLHRNRNQMYLLDSNINYYYKNKDNNINYCQNMDSNTNLYNELG